MKAQISHIGQEYIEVGEAGQVKMYPGTFSVELIVVECEESRDQVVDWFKDKVKFELTPVEES